MNYHFADLWLLRLTPTFLNQEVYIAHKNSGLISRFAGRWFPSSGLGYLPVSYKNSMEGLIVDEIKRPAHGQYVWAHLYIPHGPHNLNRRCDYQGDAGYDEQAMCSIKLMAKFISKLKSQGKYHESMIIFHSFIQFSKLSFLYIFPVM